ncbi:hypothetical protein NQ314_002616 [Rhamnusium bicolor]|uniref:PAS domain-containing protein n=1 Tax=Rhamnusium bicolor TaxID=1586634 RepID=A0AAV8ZS53_9CUCU|nr:hypothetical protein NQ314_002616 [Rhamnusium bicolor]
MPEQDFDIYWNYDTIDDDSDDKDSKSTTSKRTFPPWFNVDIRKNIRLKEKAWRTYKMTDNANGLANFKRKRAKIKMDIDISFKNYTTIVENCIQSNPNKFWSYINELAVRSRINEIQEDWKPTFLTNEEFTHLVLEAVDGFIMFPKFHILIRNKEICMPYVLHYFLGSDEDMVQDDNRFNGYSGEADTRPVFVGTGRIQTPQLIKEMPLVDSIKSEFTSRHSLEWKFLFLDHRAPPIIGYLPFELLGTSGYDYYHVDDLNKVVSCHEALMQKAKGLRVTIGFSPKWNSKPEFIVCTHRVVSYTDVMKQSQKRDFNGFENSEESSPSLGGGSSALPWPSKGGSKSVVRHRPASDCTSMSADSPGSRQSVMTSPRSAVTESCYYYLQKPRTSNPLVSQSNSSQQVQPHLQHQPLEIQIQQPQQIEAAQFLESPQYVTSIPVQSMIANFPSPVVLSPLQQIDNMEMSPANSQLQADLQRKHAELQAMIGQQQQELRRVSEQILMARLGILPGSQPQPVVANVPISYQTSNMVSSTTTSGVPTSMAGAPSVIVPVSLPISLPLQHQQHQHQNIMYNVPDSNTQSK